MEGEAHPWELDQKAVALWMPRPSLGMCQSGASRALLKGSQGREIVRIEWELTYWNLLKLELGIDA